MTVTLSPADIAQRIGNLLFDGVHMETLAQFTITQGFGKGASFYLDLREVSITEDNVRLLLAKKIAEFRK